MAFNIGDCVVCIVDNPDDNSSITIGSTGVVLHCDPPRDGHESYLVDVRWDYDVGGHTCGGRCQQGFGWTVFATDIEPEKEYTLPDMEDVDSLLNGLFDDD